MTITAQSSASHSDAVSSREPGYLEAICAHVAETYDNSFSVPAMVSVGFDVQEASFREALEALFDSRPSLRATISPDQQHILYNAVFSNVEVERVEVKDEKAVEAVFTASTAPFQAQKALWRAKLVQVKGQPNKSFIIIAAAHAICDARSLAHCFATLVKYIMAIQAGKPIPREAEHAIPSSLEAALPASRLQQAGSAAASPAVIFPATPKFSGASARNCSGGDVFLELNEAEFRALQFYARQESTTITAALCAAFILAIRAKYPALLGAASEGASSERKRSLRSYASAAKRSHVATPPLQAASIAADFRQHTSEQLPWRVVGSYSFNVAYVAPHAPSFWGLARACKDQYTKALEGTRHVAPENTRASVSSFASTVEATLDQGSFPLYPGVSNTGSLDDVFAGLGGVVRDFRFSIRQEQMPVVPVALFAASVGERLGMVFNYSTPTVSSQQARGLAEGVISELRSAAPRMAV